MICATLLSIFLTIILPAVTAWPPLTQYEIQIKVFPVGFLIKFGHETGVNSVHINGECLAPDRHLGLFKGTCIRTNDGYWTYENINCVLNIDDAIDYTLRVYYVNPVNFVYIFGRQRFFVRGNL